MIFEDYAYAPMWDDRKGGTLLKGRRLRAFGYATVVADAQLVAPVMSMAWNDPESRKKLGAMKLREKVNDKLTEPSEAPMNSTLPLALQDLGWEIMRDVAEACDAFNDPDIWYPGVDTGIEPVPDSHVELVIWATQRELNRELRSLPKSAIPTKLPAVPLAELPFRIQRAFAERRRLRYQEFGIGRAQWESGEWSLWDIPLDEDWVPRRYR